MRWRSRPGSPRLTVCLIGLVVLVLLTESVLGWAAMQQAPLTVSLTVSFAPTGGGSITVLATSHRPFPIQVRVGALPGSVSNSPRTAYVLVDPSYPAIFGSYGDVLALEQRVTVLLAEMGSSVQLQPVTSGGLAAALNASPDATLVIAEYGAIPPALASGNSSLLHDWIAGGGTLIWAGGPLGYFEPPVGIRGEGCCPPGLGWAGQSELVGFPLTDPGTVLGSADEPAGGPATGEVPTDLATAFGTTYNGTLYGANVTELMAHGGISLGFQTSGGVAAARTSLAYLPLGAGRVFYFGNAVWSPTGQYTPLGGLTLSVDIARLLATDYVPLIGAASSAVATVPADGTTSILVPFSAIRPVAVVLESSTNGIPLWEFSENAIPSG